MREQKILRRKTIINNMLTIGKITAQGLQARSGTCLHFDVCEQGDKHCASKGLLNKEEWEACQEVSYSENMAEQPPHMCTDTYTTTHLVFQSIQLFSGLQLHHNYTS